MTIDRRVRVPMTGWKQARWLLFYAAMLLADAAVSAAVVAGTSSPLP